MRAFLRQRSYKNLNKVTVSKKTLLANHSALQKFHPKTVVCPVLKSNAYGHGLKEVASIFDSMKCQFLVVDSLFEAYLLQKLRVRTPVLILGYMLPSSFTAERIPFDITLFDIESAKILNKHQPGCNIHIFVDTGMSREGVRIEDLQQFLTELKKLKNLNVVGLCSHFADADNPNSHQFTDLQVKTYKKALAIVSKHGFSPKWRHISASAGTFKVHDQAFNMIRAGLAHYGINPLEGGDDHRKNITLHPVLEFSSTLVQVKKIQKGARIGYNGTYRAEKTMILGLLPAGYYEGVDRRLSNKGYVKIRDQFFPIVGRVSMNMTVIDITKLKQPKVGESVIIYSSKESDQNSITNAAKQASTIPYELLVHIADSVKRVII